MPTSGVSDNCSGLPLQPADHARSTPSYLAHTGGAAQATSCCRILGSYRDQACGLCPEHSAVVATGLECSQGCEHQQVVFGHNALLCGALEMIGAAVVPVHGPLVVAGHPPLESVLTVVFCPHLLQTTQEAPLLTQPTLSSCTGCS